MILQQLVRDAERIVGGLPPPSYDRKPVKWIVDLDAQGNLKGVVQTSGGGGKRDRGNPLLVPFVVRTSGVRAILLADTPAYSLGMAEGDRRVEAKHQAYRELVARCTEQTGHPGVAAVLRFLDAWQQDRPAATQLRAAMPDLDKSDLVSFRVDHAMPIEDSGVQRFWTEHCASTGREGDEAATECVSCGQRRPIGESLPVLIKRVPGGQSSGVAPASINAPAFESYGLKAGKSSGVCRECGERFGKALNELLARDDSHLRVGPLVYVFWTRQGAGFSYLTFLSKPDSAAVKDLLSSYRTGVAHLAGDETAFYATALSASGGRAVIRDWLTTTLGSAKANLARWFALLSQVDAYGAPGDPLGIFRLAACLYLDATKHMVPQVPQALVKAALHGDSLPSWLLTQAVNRCRAEQGITYPRAALIKAVLMSDVPGKEAHMSSLEQGEMPLAYTCGRLLAVLEQVQRAANPGINATLVDRFYGAASTAPASVFGNLLTAAQPHLSKLRKTNERAHQALQSRLEEVMAPIPTEGFPRTLNLQDQALFSLGYYHQRAHDRAQARERAEAKSKATAAAGPEKEATDV